MVRTLVLIGIGGGAGSILRYLTTLGVNKYLAASSSFPWGTLAVNFIGSFFAGMILSYFSKDVSISNEWQLFLMTGFCGGYTTFSAFSVENLVLLQSGQTATAMLYIGGSILLSLLAVWAGFLCAG